MRFFVVIPLLAVVLVVLTHSASAAPVPGFLCWSVPFSPLDMVYSLMMYKNLSENGMYKCMREERMRESMTLHFQILALVNYFC